MENMKVMDLTISTDKFPKISDTASLFEALSALEKAQESFLAGKAQQRVLLVENDSGQVIGKLSPIDLFRGLETNYDKVNFAETLNNYGLKYLNYIANAMQKDYDLWKSPFADLCRKAGHVHVRDFFKAPDEGQSVKIGDNLSRCFHLFVMGRHDTLFVFKGDDIVGILTFSDVYRQVSKTMKACSF